MISKEVKNKGIGDDKAIFKMFGLGVATNRDQWAYDKDPIQLENKVQKLITVYDRERKINKGIDYQNFAMKSKLDYSIKWSRDLLKDMQVDKEIIFDKNHIRKSLYRPFCQSHLYFGDGIVDVLGLNRRFFPQNRDDENVCIIFNGFNTTKWDVITAKHSMDLNAFYGGSVHTPLYVYDESGNKTSNVTDWGLALFREKYGKDITEEAIFAYCYAVLSSPNYQEKYADNLKTDYPRIPMYDDFKFYRSRGERLISLHADYDKLELDPQSLDSLVITRDDDYLPTGIENPNKNGVTHPMKIDKKNGVLILDNHNKIENIPLEVFDYKIGSRSALDWIVEYHKPKKLNPEKELHHATLINEGLDTYDWKTIRAYLFDLVPKIVAVSLETLEIYGELSEKEG